MIAIPQTPAADVVRHASEISVALAALEPNVDTGAGAFAELVVYWNAVLAANAEANAERLRKAGSLASVAADPTAFADEELDAVLSNFRATPRPGSRAEGRVTIVTRDDLTTTIGAGTLFVRNGLNYEAVDTFTGRREAAVEPSPGDRLLRRSGTMYAFDIEIRAVGEGSQYTLDRGATLTSPEAPSNVVQIVAAENFRNGIDAESRIEALGRLAVGLAPPSPGSRLGVAALFASHPVFSGYVDHTVIGCGDPEMSRDEFPGFPVRFGGRSDWYVRAAEALSETMTEVEASFVERDIDGRGVWSIPSEALPIGRYAVASVRTTTDLVCPIAEEVVDFVGGLRPRIATIFDCGFSAKRRLSARFIDPHSSAVGLVVGTRRTYRVWTIGGGDLAAIRDYLADPQTADFGSDTLVKAPPPCRVSIDMRLADAGPGSPLDAFRTELVRRINRLRFGEALYASLIHDAVRDFMPKAGVVSLDISGEIIYPDGAKRTIRDPYVLRFPNEPHKGVTPRIGAFFAKADAVSVVL